MDARQNYQDVTVAEGPEGLARALLGHVKTNQDSYILYQLNDQKSVILVDTHQQLWHYDLMGRPATPVVKEQISECFPDSLLHDLSRGNLDLNLEIVHAPRKSIEEAKASLRAASQAVKLTASLAAATSAPVSSSVSDLNRPSALSLFTFFKKIGKRKTSALNVTNENKNSRKKR